MSNAAEALIDNLIKATGRSESFTDDDFKQLIDLTEQKIDYLAVEMLKSQQEQIEALRINEDARRGFIIGSCSALSVVAGYMAGYYKDGE
jgi:hypothetical protein